MKFMRGFLPRFVNLVQNRLRKQLDKRDLSRSKVSYHGLFSIAVANEMKGKNLGKVLLDSFEDELRKMRVEKYVVSVRKNNLRAIKFCRKSGFCLQKETTAEGESVMADSLMTVEEVAKYLKVEESTVYT